MKHFSIMENNWQTKVMLLVVFPKKRSLSANRQFRAFEIALRGRGISPNGAIRNFAGGIFLLGIWLGVFLTIGTFFKAKNNLLCILNILNIFRGGEGNEQIFACGWRLPFIPLVRKILQFLPNLSQFSQNYVS